MHEGHWPPSAVYVKRRCVTRNGAIAIRKRRIPDIIHITDIGEFRGSRIARAYRLYEDNVNLLDVN